LTQQQKDQIVNDASAVYCDMNGDLQDRFKKLADIVWSLALSLPVEDNQ
jgi:hypothetical protein